VLKTTTILNPENIKIFYGSAGNQTKEGMA